MGCKSGADSASDTFTFNDHVGLEEAEPEAEGPVITGVRPHHPVCARRDKRGAVALADGLRKPGLVTGGLWWFLWSLGHAQSWHGEMAMVAPFTKIRNTWWRSGKKSRVVGELNFDHI